MCKFEIIGDGKNIIQKVSCQGKKDKNLAGKEGNQLIAYGIRSSVMTL